MSDEYEHKLEAKSDYVSDASSGTHAPDIDKLPPAELPDQELYHSHSWWTTYVFSQDAKYIGVQYACTAIGTGILGLEIRFGLAQKENLNRLEFFKTYLKSDGVSLIGGKVILNGIQFLVLT